MEKAADQTLRAGQIIRRLRDFVARGESEPRIEPLPKIIEEAEVLALIGAAERGIRVRNRIDGHVGLVLADKVQVQQVLVNLMRNAIEAMQSSDRRELTVSAHPTGDGMVEVAVGDTGPGISPEIIERLFEPFFTTKSQGMGVGLSISRTIIEAHGGRIWADSSDKGGATFRFTLRAVRPEDLGDHD